MENIQKQALKAAELYSPPQHNCAQNVSNTIQMEKDRRREFYLYHESQYVHEMMVNDAIMLKHRRQEEQSTIEEEVDVENVNDTYKKESQILREQERAKAFRRSRYNKKIRDARLKYYNKYISADLQKNSRAYDDLQVVMAKVELQLLARGLPVAELQQLRHSYGIEEAMCGVRNVEHIIKMEN